MQNATSNNSAPKPTFYPKLIYLFGFLILNFVLCIIVPAIIAKSNQVYTKTDIINKVKSIKTFEKEYHKYDNQRKIDSLYSFALFYTDSIVVDTIRKVMSSTTSLHVNAESVNKVRFYKDNYGFITERIKRTDKEFEYITFMSYLDNRNVYVWWLLTSCLLLILILNFDFKTCNCLSVLRGLAFSFFLWVILYGLTLYRNLVFDTYELGRRVYSYNHHDISMPNCIYQAFIFYLFCLLMSYIVVTFLSSTNRILEEDDKKFKEITHINRRIELLNENSKKITMEYESWVINSLILGFGFLVFLLVYKDLIYKFKDYRYIPSAIVIFIYWCISWYAISRPIIAKLSNYETLKSAILTYSFENEKNNYTSYESMVKENNLINKQSLFITLFIALLTLVGSVLKIFGVI